MKKKKTWVSILCYNKYTNSNWTRKGKLINDISNCTLHTDTIIVFIRTQNYKTKKNITHSHCPTNKALILLTFKQRKIQVPSRQVFRCQVEHWAYPRGALPPAGLRPRTYTVGGKILTRFLNYLHLITFIYYTSRI